MMVTETTVNPLGKDLSSCLLSSCMVLSYLDGHVAAVGISPAFWSKYNLITSSVIGSRFYCTKTFLLHLCKGVRGDQKLRDVDKLDVRSIQLHIYRMNY